MPMHHTQINELHVCDNCGAVLALGKYSPLFRLGRSANHCRDDMRQIPIADADKMLSELVAKQEGNHE